MCLRLKVGLRWRSLTLAEAAEVQRHWLEIFFCVERDARNVVVEEVLRRNWLRGFRYRSSAETNSSFTARYTHSFRLH